jgi:ribosomal protein S12 methylthiotransferase
MPRHLHEEQTRLARKKTAVKLLTLGCPKNVVDSEAMMGILNEKGYALTDREERADVLIVNTCAFIEPAKEESIEAILETARWKERDPSKRLIVTGCLAQRYAKELATEMPEVDAFVGTSEFMHIADVVESTRRAGPEPHPPILRVSSPAYQYTQPFPRMRATPWHTAYLKVGEGCDNRCTFCAIPSFRGDYVSRPADTLVREAETLAASGVKELVLISQDTTFYGRDLNGKPQLPELLTRLARVDGVEWVRTLYAYPSLVDDDLLDVLRDEPKVCSYLDVPLQHIDNEILRRMARGIKESQLRELVPRVRERVPNIALRTSFIVGFPGETDEQFDKLAAFVAESRFEHAGVFRFSPEEGTPAAAMPNPVPEEVVEERFMELVATQTEVARENRSRYVGTTVRVLVDGKKPKTPLLEARMESQAPEIDDVVYLRNATAKSGQFVQARVVEAYDFDLLAEVVEGTI